jgi:predicted transposase YdaD
LHIEHLNAVVVYITTVSPSISVETLEMTIQKIFQTQIEPGSIADEYMKKGRLQGIQEGRQEGRQEGLKEGNIQLIQTLQEILGLPASEASTLEHRSLEQLQAITAELRQQIRDRS